MNVKYKTGKNGYELKTWCNHVPFTKVASRTCKNCIHFRGIDMEKWEVNCDREAEKWAED